jgi:hypothetical protein
MQGLTPITIVVDGLQKITLPPLTRPSVGPKEEPTEKLVSWGINYYAYSALAHVRTVLQGLILLADAGNVPTTYFSARNIFEWAAHACYMSRNLATYVNKKEWGRAWKLLSMAAMGNKWMKDHGPKYEPTAAFDGIPDPLNVANVVAAYDEYRSQQFGKGNAKDDYGLLSEYSHPNSACIFQYHKYREQEVRFVTPSTGSPLPSVNWCLIDLMMFFDELFRISGEQTVRPQIASVLEEIAKLAPATRP